MSRKATHSLPADQPLPTHLISRQTLQLTQVLLRNNNPSLATKVQQALASVKPRPAIKGTSKGKRLPVQNEPLLYTELLSQMDIPTVSAILAALNHMAQRALSKPGIQPESRAIMSQLLQEWADLVEWVLRRASVEKGLIH